MNSEQITNEQPDIELRISKVLFALMTIFIIAGIYYQITHRDGPPVITSEELTHILQQPEVSNEWADLSKVELTKIFIGTTQESRQQRLGRDKKIIYYFYIAKHQDLSFLVRTEDIKDNLVGRFQIPSSEEQRILDVISKQSNTKVSTVVFHDDQFGTWGMVFMTLAFVCFLVACSALYQRHKQAKQKEFLANFNINTHD